MGYWLGILSHELLDAQLRFVEELVGVLAAGLVVVAIGVAEVVVAIEVEGLVAIGVEGLAAIVVELVVGG